MIIKQAKTKENINNALKVRKEVFVDEQGIDINIERDEHDWTDAIHVIAISDNDSIGAGRFIPTDAGAKIQRMAVLKPNRNEGVGAKILLKLLELIEQKDFDRVYFSAQKTAENFYGKYGFKSYGEEFEEVGLPHVMMEKLF
ncbi:MAG: GNAT family N-acetyltransferase [Candidatus Pacebacteria bacterium]|nr:GNAT family N-acetyltransferase [Candidatus Paceibacterota bacterium]